MIPLRPLNPRTRREWTWYDREDYHDCTCVVCCATRPSFAWTNDCWPRRSLTPTDVDGPNSGPLLVSVVEMGGLYGCSRYFLFEFKSEQAGRVVAGQRDALVRLQAELPAVMTLIEIHATSPGEAHVHLAGPYAPAGDWAGHVTIHWLRSWLHQAAAQAAAAERAVRDGSVIVRNDGMRTREDSR
jgi:hypothetical protein